MCFSFEMCEGVYNPSFHGINGLFDYIPLRENVCMLHPQRGLKLANAGIIVQFRLSNPDGIVTLNMRDKPRPGSPERTLFSAAVGKGKKVGGWRRKAKWQRAKLKWESPNGEISGRAEKRALSANQRFFRQVLGTKERPKRFLHRSRPWDDRKKILERRGASFSETSSERLEAEGKNVKF